MKRAISIFCAIALTLAAGTSALSQSPTPATRKNFAYSQNPKTKPHPEGQSTTPNPTPAPVADAVPASTPQIARNEPSIANKTREVALKAAKTSAAPTETYVIGNGDVLFVSLQNSPKASTYYTVLNDGTIDYPLAGEMVPVAGLTTEEAEDLLISKIKLYDSPQVSVRVREYNSHRVTVLGLVENAGERSIQREAVPLFVIRADAVVKPAADAVTIKRSSGSVERFGLRDRDGENTLIFPGDIVEFISSRQAVTNDADRFVFLSGEVATVGKLAFNDGLTLSQALIVAGGPKKGAKKAKIRRKNAAGMLESTEFNLRAISDGKAPDPVLLAGDIIEIGN